jgi:RimJ/RimL family protein N-acetyltransferase
MIKGKLVGLRALEVGDLNSLRDWRNIDSFRTNFREVRELNLTNQEGWFNKLSASPNDYMFGIVDLESNELIGACGLLYINQVIKSADFSFYIGKDEIYVDDSNGLSEEAARLLIDYGFNRLNLNKIWMELYDFDVKKIKFFTGKFNFQIDGKLRENCYHDGKYHDSKILSLLASEFSGE